MDLLFSIPAVQTLLVILISSAITLGVLLGYIHHKRDTQKLIKKQEEHTQQELYIKTILDQLPSSGDQSLDMFRRMTLDTQLRGILEQQKLSKLKEQEIATQVAIANNVASQVHNQVINNYNGGK